MNALVPLALRGEILPNTVNVLWLPHPFNENRTERHACPAGWTLAEIVEEVCDGQEGVRAWADGVRIEPADWHHVCPARDVTLRYVPGPFLIPLIPVIAATIGAALVPASGFIIAGVTISAALAGAIITTVGALLSLGLSMLFRPSPPQLQGLNERQASPTYNITGIGNTQDPYGVVPIVLGRHRIFPPFASKAFTEVIGNDQYINALFCIGYGEPAVSEMKIAETPVTAFDDIEIATHVLEPGGSLPSAISNFVEEEVFQISLGVGDDPITADPRTSDLNSDALSVDIVAPQGVYLIDTRGNTRVHRAKFRIEYRLVGDTPWTVAFDTEVQNNIRGEVVRKGYRWNVTRGQYEVRIVRLEHAPTQFVELRTDQLYWTVLRSHRFDQPVTFDSTVTLVSLRIRATDQLSGQIDSFNCIVQQKGWKYDGADWADEQEISRPSDIFRTMLTNPANPKPIDEANIDFVTLNPWADDCIAKGWAFNQVRDFEASFWQCLTDVCAAGRAMPVVIDGKWGVIWERATPPAVTQAFTPRNTLSFSGERAYEVAPHGYRVQFINEDVGYQQDERIVYDDGFSDANATLIEGMDFPGVTDANLIWRLGRYHIAQRRLRRETYTIEVDIEQVACRRGDRVRVNHDVPMWGHAFGRVKAVNGDLITLDEPVSMIIGRAYVMRFRSVDGSNHNDLLRTVETVEGLDQATVTLTGSGDLPAEGDAFMFGETTAESVVLRVMSIQPGADFSARITLVDDAPGVLLADEGEIPPFETGITAAVSARDFVATDLRVTEQVVFEGDQALAELRFSFKPPALANIAGHQVQWRAAGEPVWSRSAAVEPAGTEFLTRVPPGEWEFRVRSRLLNGQSTGWAEISHTAEGAYATPPDVTGARIAISGSRVALSWNTAGVEGVRGAEIRHSTATTGATIASSRVLLSRAVNGSAQVPNLRGTYLIRWEGAFGQFSASPATIINTVADLVNFNVVEEIDEHPAFAGTVSGDVMVSGGTLVLPAGGAGTYEFANSIDLGAVHPSRISLRAGGFGENTTDTFFGDDGTDPYFDGGPWFSVAPDDWTVLLEYRETDDNPLGTPVWSEWVQVDQSEVSGRAFEFRASVESLRPEVSVTVDELTAIVDMPDRIFAVEDAAVGTSGTRIAFDPPFKEVQAVGVTVQDAPEGARLEVTNKDETGVDVQVISGGSGVAVTVDVIAKGYGQVIA